MADLLLSTLRGGGSGSLPIGSMTQFASNAALVVQSGMTFLRTGSVVSSSLASIAATSVPSVQYIPWDGSMTVGANNVVTSIDSDGAGNWIACCPHISGSGGLGAGNLRRSTDNGQTWATVNVGGTFAFDVASVCRTTTHWVVVGNNASTMHVARSTTGAAGTWTVTTSLSAFSGAALDTARIAASPQADGTLFAICGTTTQAFSSVDHGTNWSSRTLFDAPAIQSGTNVPHPIFIAGLVFVPSNAFASWGTYQRASVGTWTFSRHSGALSAGTPYQSYALASNGVVAVSNSGMRSVNGIDWVQSTPPQGLHHSVRHANGQFYQLRTRQTPNLYVGFICSSSDGILWAEQNTNLDINVTAVGGFSVGQNSVMVLNGAANTLRRAETQNVQWVGDSFALGDISTSNPTVPWYRRIA